MTTKEIAEKIYSNVRVQARRLNPSTVVYEARLGVGSSVPVFDEEWVAGVPDKIQAELVYRIADHLKELVRPRSEEVEDEKRLREAMYGAMMLPKVKP